MPTRIGARYAALHALPVIRIGQSGDRRSARDLIVSVRVRLDPHAECDIDRLAAAVYALAPTHAAEEPERFASVIARHCRERLEGVAATRVDVLERGWSHLDVGGRPRDRDLIAADAPRRAARAEVTVRGEHVSAGMRGVVLLRGVDTTHSSVAMVRLNALWRYGWTGIPYDAQWLQVRRALLEASAERPLAGGPALAVALGQAVLDESPAVSRIRLRLDVERRPALDLTAFGMENTGEVFGAGGQARGVHSVVLTRDELNGEEGSWPDGSRSSRSLH